MEVFSRFEFANGWLLSGRIHSITGDTGLLFLVADLCTKLSQGGSCEVPTLYKQNVMETGDTLFTDESHTITGSIPGALDDGRWIMTADADANQSNTDYLSFDVPSNSKVFVAYDAAASSVPAWLSGYTDTGLFVATSNASAPSLRLYRKDSVLGTLELAGADATTHSAGSNYIVIIVED